MRLILNGGARIDAELVGTDRNGRRLYDDGGPNMLVDGLDCEPEPEDDDDPFPGECRFEAACRAAGVRW